MDYSAGTAAGHSFVNVKSIGFQRVGINGELAFLMTS
jgi:hypothetical protein